MNSLDSLRPAFGKIARMLIDPISPQVLRGRVVAGLGNVGYKMTLLSELYAEKTSMRLYPGTLNLKLAEPWRVPREKAIRIEKQEYGGSIALSLVPCRVFGRDAFIVRTDSAEESTGKDAHTILEIATDVRLREVYSLADGAEVAVEV